MSVSTNSSSSSSSSLPILPQQDRPKETNVIQNKPRKEEANSDEDEEEIDFAELEFNTQPVIPTLQLPILLPNSSTETHQSSVTTSSQHENLPIIQLTPKEEELIRRLYAWTPVTPSHQLIWNYEMKTQRFGNCKEITPSAPIAPYLSLFSSDSPAPPATTNKENKLQKSPMDVRGMTVSSTASSSSSSSTSSSASASSPASLLSSAVTNREQGIKKDEKDEKKQVLNYDVVMTHWENDDLSWVQPLIVELLRDHRHGAKLCKFWIYHHHTNPPSFTSSQQKDDQKKRNTKELFDAEIQSVVEWKVVDNVGRDTFTWSTHCRSLFRTTTETNPSCIIFLHSADVTKLTTTTTTTMSTPLSTRTTVQNVINIKNLLSQLLEPSDQQQQQQQQQQKTKIKWSNKNMKFHGTQIMTRTNHTIESVRHYDEMMKDGRCKPIHVFKDLKACYEHVLAREWPSNNCIEVCDPIRQSFCVATSEILRHSCFLYDRIVSLVNDHPYPQASLMVEALLYSIMMSPFPVLE